MNNECPYCEDEIAQGELKLRWRGRWYHPDCARDTAESEGETWSPKHPLAGPVEEVVAKLKLDYSEPWCVCLEDLLYGWHTRWPVRLDDGDPYHYCPTCDVIDPISPNAVVYGECPNGHPAPRQE